MTNHFTPARRIAAVLFFAQLAGVIPVDAGSSQAESSVPEKLVARNQASLPVTDLRMSIERASRQLTRHPPKPGGEIRRMSAAQTQSNGRRGTRVARVITGLAMVGGGVALAKWGYDRPNQTKTSEVCTGPSFAPNIPGLPSGLQQQINNLGNRCEHRSDDVGRTGTAAGAIVAGISLSAIGAVLALVP